MKGFTLVELLAVIVILGVLTAVTTVAVSDTIKNSKNKLTDIQIDTIEEVAEMYYLKEGMNNIDYENDTHEDCVEVSYLIDNGYFDDVKIIDASTVEEIEGSVKISYKSNQYTYKYQTKSCSQ